MVSPASLLAEMAPPWSSTISLAMAKPRPAPPVPGGREDYSRKNGTKMRPSIYKGLGAPELAKVRMMASCPTVAAMFTTVPAVL